MNEKEKRKWQWRNFYKVAITQWQPSADRLLSFDNNNFYS
jgi:hypothetical protein